VIVETTTGESRKPFPPGGASASPRWSPDGRQLAACVQHEGRECLSLWDVRTGAVRILQQAEVAPLRFGFEVPEWLPDGRSIAVRLITSEPSARLNVGATVRQEDAAPCQVFSFDPAAAAAATGTSEGAAFAGAHDLGLIDVASGEVRRLATGWRFETLRVAPDGHAIALLRTVVDLENPTADCYDLVTVAVADGAVRRLAPRVQQGYGCCFNWSPDSRQIAFVHVEEGGRGQLLTVPADGSAAPRVLSGDEALDLPLNDYYQAPRWSPDGRTVYVAWRAVWAFAADGSARRKIAPEMGRLLRAWVQPPTTPTLHTPDGRSLLVTTSDRRTKQDGLARIDLETGEGTLLAEFDHMWGVHVWGTDEPFWIEVAPDGSACFLAAEAANYPMRILRLAGEFRTGEPLYALKPDTRSLRLGRSRLVEYRTLAARETARQAALMLPPDYEEGASRLPVVVDLYHGTRFSGWVHSFGHNGFNPGNVTNAHLFASRGYAVLRPDVLLESRDLLRRLAGEVLPAIHHLVDLGIADPERVCLIGHSRGGYGALALLTQTDLFCAAAVSAAALYAPWDGGDLPGMGTPWERRDAYVENSPFFYLDRVRTPVLVVCGTASAEEEAQARQTFRALHRLGGRVELRLYRDEGHSPSEWTEPNLRDVTGRILSWFDTFARQGPPPPAP
jgi:dipeptidyl aminopeptidase/acylaminoacyl peptidase